MVNSWVVVRMPPLKRFTFVGGIYVEYPTVFGEIYVKYIWSNNCLGYFLTLPVVTMITRISFILLGIWEFQKLNVQLGNLTGLGDTHKLSPKG